MSSNFLHIMYFKGHYEICFDNQHSQIGWKLVSIYILTFHQEQVLERFNKDKEMNETAHIVQVYSFTFYSSASVRNPGLKPRICLLTHEFISF